MLRSCCAHADLANRHAYATCLPAVKGVVRTLCDKFEPRSDTKEGRATRAVIAKATRDFLFNLDKPVRGSSRPCGVATPP